MAKVGFKTFLNVVPSISHAAGTNGAKPADPSAAPSSDNTGASAALQEFTLTLDENPLAEFVELPPEVREGGLWFSNVLVGVLKGALEMVSAFEPAG